MQKNQELVDEIIAQTKSMVNDDHRKQLIEEIKATLPNLEFTPEEKQITIDFIKKIEEKRKDNFLVKQIHTYLEASKQKELAQEFLDKITALNRIDTIEGLVRKIAEIDRTDFVQSQTKEIVEKIRWLHGDALQTPEQQVAALREIVEAASGLLKEVEAKLPRPAAETE